jgi:UPF0716 protein FxsA
MGPAELNLGDRGFEAKRGKCCQCNWVSGRINTSPESKAMIGLLILVALPLIEIAVMIKVGQWIGFWPAFGLVVATFIVGSLVLGRSGFTSALRVREALERGEPPVAAMVDSAMVVVAAILLITPGFIADVVGLALLIPPIRRMLAHVALRNAFGLGDIGMRRGSFEERTPRGAADAERGAPTGTNAPGPVIEGEFERLDERPVDRPGPEDGGDRRR